MQTIQTIIKDTVTNNVHITRPKIIFQQSESEKGFIMCSKNTKKIIVPTTKGYLYDQIEMYSMNNVEKGYWVSLLEFVTQDNLLCIDKLPLTRQRYAARSGMTIRSVHNMFNILEEKKIIKRIRRKKDEKYYMLNPVFGCFRNCITYKMYYVFRKELEDYLKGTNQEDRIENIQKHFERQRAEVEREVEIL